MHAFADDVVGLEVLDVDGLHVVNSPWLLKGSLCYASQRNLGKGVLCISFSSVFIVGDFTQFCRSCWKIGVAGWVLFSGYFSGVRFNG